MVMMKQKICWDFKKRPEAIDNRIRNKPRPLTEVQAGCEQRPNETPDDVEEKVLREEEEQL